jgi:hypothetical protein
MAGTAHAASTLIVGTLNDTSSASDCGDASNVDCSLRQAITDSGAGDTIAFRSGLSGTITLASGLPAVTHSLTIQGPGAETITVDGDASYRLFDIHPATGGDPVAISGLTLANGSPEASSTHHDEAGAILNETADLTVSDSVISGNTAPVIGGAIYSGVGADASTGYAANLNLIDTTVSGNSVPPTGANGGAIYLNYGGATISGSTISGNDSGEGGGAISMFIMNAPVLIENSTIAGNAALGPPGIRRGGAIFLLSNPSGLTISNSTVSANTATHGSGIYSSHEDTTGPDQTTILENSIVDGNTGTSDLANGGPSPAPGFDAAFSLIGSATEATLNQSVAGSNILGVSPQLAALADNGGPTETMLPQAGSPVIDKGCRFGLVTDQRALTRPVDLPDYNNSAAVGADGSDIGAAELQTSPGGGDATGTQSPGSAICPPSSTPSGTTTPPSSSTPAPTTPTKKKCKKKHKRSASAAKKKCKKK